MSTPIIRLRVRPDGTVAGLWDDAVDWQAVGRCVVRRASRVEFDDAEQVWTVRPVRCRSTLRVDVPLFTSPSRSEALAWEHAYFGPGGPHWPRRGIGHALKHRE